MLKLSSLKNIWLVCLLVTSGAMVSSTVHAENSLHAVLETIKHLDTGLEEQDLDHISFVKRYPFKEVADALINRFDIEVQRIYERHVDEKPLSTNVLFELMAAIEMVANSESQIEIEHASAQLTPVLKASKPFLMDFGLYYTPMMEAVQHRTEPLPSMRKLLTSRTQTTLGLPAPVTVTNAARLTATNVSKDVSARATDFLSKRVIEQPEVVSALADLEFRNRVYYGKRTKPEVIWLLGQAGTGKDTTAEAYTDLINGEQTGAHEHEMFRFPVMRSEADLWKLFGSNTGYIGSDNFPPLLKYLVEHSGGKYQINERRTPSKTEYYITERDTHGDDGVSSVVFSPPERAVVFLNEFHNWSKEARDSIKEIIEKGIFPINNPLGGLDKIRVPVTFIIASNDAISLVTSREMNGERFGPPLSYEQSLAKWQAVHSNYQVLRAELMRANGPVNQAKGGGSRGYSEEFINRLPDQALLLLRPVSPKGLQAIAEIKLNALSEKMSNPESRSGHFRLKWTPKVNEFLQSYHYQAEDNARPIGAKTDNLIEQTLLDVIRDGEIPKFDETLILNLDVATNVDRTVDLLIQVGNVAGNKIKTIRRLIRATEADREKQLMDRSRIEHLSKLNEYLRQKVFGLDEAIVDRLTRSILLAEEAKYGREESDQPRDGAKILGFFGLSSSGKTETSSVLGEFLYGQREAKVTIDFSQVQSVEDMKHRILGTRDHNGNPIPSEFMKHYDRSNGKNLVFVFDELANAPKWATKTLYDIFRESVVTTFADGKPRSMNGITIILTGNAGEEWYRDIPRDVPEMVQMYAMHQVYAQGNSNPHLRRQLLETYFSEALINRIGERNIFFFSPASFKSIRELGQLKLMQAVESLKPHEGRYGWNVVFNSVEDFKSIMEMIDEHGFVIREQGASIDRFVKQEFDAGIRHLLVTKNVPVGSKVVISRNLKAEKVVNSNGRSFRELHLTLKPEGRDAIDFAIEGKEVIQYAKVRDEDRIITAAHESGHAITQAILFAGASRPAFLSIIPGVTHINNQWVYYAGIAGSSNEREPRPTREVMLFHMAVFAGGEVAESLVTKNKRTGAGKSNDMERATALAINAVVRWGLSPRWGTMSVPSGMSTEDFIRSLPEDRRKLLYDEVELMIREARELARTVLVANMDNAVVPLAMLVAEKGRLNGEEMKTFFDSHKLNGPVNGKFKITAGQMRWVSGQTAPKSLDAELVDWMPRPSKVATLEEVVNVERAAQIAQVQIPAKLPLATSEKEQRKVLALPLKRNVKAGCEDLLRGSARAADSGAADSGGSAD